MMQKPDGIIIKTKQQIEGIRKSGRINTAVLDYLSDHIGIGMSTEDINRMVHEQTIRLGGYPAPLDYEGFPKSVCTSVNDVVCHGIPSDQCIMRDGDIINIDLSTVYQGYFSDSSRMFCIGNVPSERRKLVRIAKEAIAVGLAQVKPWSYLGDVGAAINTFVRSHGYSVVREIGGHGIGLKFHEEPFVSYVAAKGTGILMVPGMIFTIEPMVNAGKPGVIIDEGNGWTVYTKDGTDSAQWEVTVLVTENGSKILAE